MSRVLQSSCGVKIALSIAAWIAAGAVFSPSYADAKRPWLSFLHFKPPAVPFSDKKPSTRTACLPQKIKWALSDVERRFGKVLVVSTRRPGARINGTRRPSLHASCKAVDFRPANGKYGAVARYLRKTWRGGLGTYSSGHIHIDTGPNLRWHAGKR